MKKRAAFTLLEIMIVIFLIGLIGSVIGYNIKGSLDKGKKFKTIETQKRLVDILELMLAQGDLKAAEIGTEELEKLLERSALVKNPKQFIQDGWGNLFTASVDAEGKLVVTSPKYQLYEHEKD